MTTDNDEVHGTVIDRGYPSESESPMEPADTADGDVDAPRHADIDAQDAEDYERAEDEEGDEHEEDYEEDEDDEGDGVMVVESSSVVSEDGTQGAAGDEADEASGPGVTDLHDASPGYETPPEDVSGLDAAPDAVDGLEPAPGTVAPAHAAPAPAHSRVAGDSQFAGDAGLAGDADEMYRRWTTIQSGFVDDPRESVADAAAFLNEVVTTLVDNARQREQELRDQWDGDTGLDTETMRIVLRRYRALLERFATL